MGWLGGRFAVTGLHTTRKVARQIKMLVVVVLAVGYFAFLIYSFSIISEEIGEREKHKLIFNNT